MRHWSQLATRNWSASRGAFIATAVAVGLGVSVVVIITSFYESALSAVKKEVVTRWLGSAHISVEPPGAHWGSLDASVATDIAGIENVAHVTARLRRRMLVVSEPKKDELLEVRAEYVDAIGIDPDTEQHFLTLPRLAGRMIEPDERGVAVIEAQLAQTWRVDLGDDVRLVSYRGGPAAALKIVGIFDSQRVADFQRPAVYAPIADIQDIKNQPGKATVIDVMLGDYCAEALARAEQAIQAVLRQRDLTYSVQSAAARLAQLEEAERLTRMAVIATAVVTLLTAFFIILTTTSASLYTRSRLLGLMRCIGITRRQLAALVVIEVTPPTIVGALVGTPLGAWLTIAIAWWGREYAPPIYVSGWGISVAVGCAIATWALSMGILIVQVCLVSPLRAANPQARPPRLRYIVLAAFVGVVLVGVHEWTLYGMDPGYWLHPFGLSIGSGAQFVGFVLIVPLIVVVLGGAMASIAGPLFGLHSALARDQFGRAPWLSAGVCWVLMVGLGLIVFTALRTEGAMMAFWDFPSRLPEAFVWSPHYADATAIERVKTLPGVGKLTIVTDVDCQIEPVWRRSKTGTAAKAADSFLDAILGKLTRPVFVAGDPDTFLEMAKLGFSQSTQEEVRQKLARGGYVVVPPQTAKAKGVGKGDKLRVTVGTRSAVFEIADVVESPALDIAVTFFKAESYMQFAAAAAVLGTRDDLRDKLGKDVVSMVMCNVDLPPSPVPQEFKLPSPPRYKDAKEVARLAMRLQHRLPNERTALEAVAPVLERWVNEDVAELTEEARIELLRFAKAARYVAYHWKNQTPEQNWTTFRERLVLFKIANAMDRPDAIMGSLQRLKDNVERDVRRAIVVLTWLPGIALAVAVLGIANLIMVRVVSRTRQIAILRAVGATKSQIVRLVLAESATLGLLGGATGIALGFYSARSDNVITENVAGFAVPWMIPWGTIALGTALTVAVCLVAGIAPARHAARSNIVSALDAT